MGIGNREQQDAVGAQHAEKFFRPRSGKSSRYSLKYAGGHDSVKTPRPGREALFQLDSRQTHLTAVSGVVAAGDGNHLLREVARGNLITDPVHGGGNLPGTTAKIEDAGGGVDTGWQAPLREFAPPGSSACPARTILIPPTSRFLVEQRPNGVSCQHLHGSLSSQARQPLNPGGAEVLAQAPPSLRRAILC